MQFSSSLPYYTGPDRLYLGKRPGLVGKHIGLGTERHAITIAGAGAGKGAIIPNLLTWAQNALVIDPKGEAAKETAAVRRNLFGHDVHVIDPFGVADMPNSFKARINPLADIDPNSATARESINAIADGKDRVTPSPGE